MSFEKMKQNNNWANILPDIGHVYPSFIFMNRTQNALFIQRKNNSSRYSIKIEGCSDNPRAVGLWKLWPCVSRPGREMYRISWPRLQRPELTRAADGASWTLHVHFFNIEVFFFPYYLNYSKLRHAQLNTKHKNHLVVFTKQTYEDNI